MKLGCWVMAGLVVVVVSSQGILASDSTKSALETALLRSSPRELHEVEARSKARGFARIKERAARFGRAPAAQSDMDARYYRLELQIYEMFEVIRGRVTMRAEALVDGFGQVALDLDTSLTVDSVYDNGIPSASWTHVNNLITIPLASTYADGQEFEVTVVYYGEPVISPWGDGLSFDMHGTTAAVSTLSEPFYARTWWPCKDQPDDKADSVDIIVEVNKDFFVSSNGTLRDSVCNGSTTTYSWHEQYPIATYLVSVAATNYRHFQTWYTYGPEDNDSMPVDFYCFPELYDSVAGLWPTVVPMIEMFSTMFGEYPFVEEKYAMTHFSWVGAMEHQTNTYMTSDPWAQNQFLIAHELAHQWWGDYVTCRDWHHIWLNEGFASYCEALYVEQMLGPAAMHTYMEPMEWPDWGTVYRSDISDAWSIFDPIVYDKGAWVLHMLRHYVGDSAFFAILRAYYTDPRCANGTATTDDFREVCETVSGQDLELFFDEWIRGQWYPVYRYEWLAEPGSEGTYNVYLYLAQQQTWGPSVFHLPIDIGIRRASGVVDTVRVFNSMRQQNFVLTIADTEAPQEVLIDPGNWIINDDTLMAYTFHIVNDTLRSGLKGVGYVDSVIAKGGVAPIQFSVITGTLPSGLALNPATGIIAGTPQQSGQFSFTVRATDASMRSVNRYYALMIAPYIPGDLDLSGAVQPPDVVLIVNHVYRGIPLSALNPADVNADCTINPVDVVCMVNYVYRQSGTLQLGCVQ